MAIGAFLAKVPPPPPPGRPRVRRGGRRKLSPLDVALDDAERRSKSGDWDGAKGATLVGLYAFCHRLTYSVVPDELQDPRLFFAAAKRAATLVHDQFNDDFGSAVSFVVWSWEREKRKEAWARGCGADRNRMSWRLQFSAALITDWRVDSRRRR